LNEFQASVDADMMMVLILILLIFSLLASKQKFRSFIFSASLLLTYIHT